jgi:hypothetical protein
MAAAKKTKIKNIEINPYKSPTVNVVTFMSQPTRSTINILLIVFLKIHTHTNNLNRSFFLLRS